MGVANKIFLDLVGNWPNYFLGEIEIVILLTHDKQHIPHDTYFIKTKCM